MFHLLQAFPHDRIVTLVNWALISVNITSFKILKNFFCLFHILNISPIVYIKILLY